jgi:hypothetical protein
MVGEFPLESMEIASFGVGVTAEDDTCSGCDVTEDFVVGQFTSDYYVHFFPQSFENTGS